MGNCCRRSRAHSPSGSADEVVNKENAVSDLADQGDDNPTRRPTPPIKDGCSGHGSARLSGTNTRTTGTQTANHPAAEEFFETSFEAGLEENSDIESYASLQGSHSVNRQTSLQSGISHCDTVVLGSLQINPRGTRTRRSKRGRGEICTEKVDELKRQVQHLRHEREEINQKYDDAAKSLTLEREVLAQAYDNTLFELKKEAQAQKASHDFQMTQMEQERNLMRMKHDNAMQDLDQREARRRCEHDQTLDDFRQREKRMQAEYESDQHKLQKKLRDIEESHREKLEQLDKKELELSKKEQLFTEKERNLKRAHEKEREDIIREHTAKMNELEKEKQVLEDNYKERVSDLEKRILSLQKDFKEKEEAIAKEREEMESKFKKQIDQLRDKKEQVIEEYAAKTRDLAENHQRFIHRQEELTHRQREREDQLQAEMDGLRLELAHKELHIETLEERISQLAEGLEDAGSPNIAQLMNAQGTPIHAPSLMEVVTRRCEMVISVHSLFQKIFIGALLEEAGIREDFEPLINKLAMFLEEMQLKGHSSIHEVNKELREIESFVQNCDSYPDTNRKHLVKAMLDFLARNG